MSSCQHSWQQRHWKLHFLALALLDQQWGTFCAMLCCRGDSVPRCWLFLGACPGPQKLGAPMRYFPGPEPPKKTNTQNTHAHTHTHTLTKQNPNTHNTHAPSASAASNRPLGLSSALQSPVWVAAAELTPARKKKVCTVAVLAQGIMKVADSSSLLQCFLPTSPQPNYPRQP